MFFSTSKTRLWTDLTSMLFHLNDSSLSRDMVLHIPFRLIACVPMRIIWSSMEQLDAPCAVPSFWSLEHSGNLSMKSMFVRFLLTFSRICCECRRCPVCWLMIYDISDYSSLPFLKHVMAMPSVWSLEHYGNQSMNPFPAYGFKNLFWMSKATCLLTHDIWHIRLIIITGSQTCDYYANTETNSHISTHLEYQGSHPSRLVLPKLYAYLICQLKKAQLFRENHKSFSEGSN